MIKAAVTSTELNTDYNDLKKSAIDFFNQGNYEISLKLIEGCAKLAYEFNFLEKFSDDDLEDLLIKNSTAILGEINKIKPEQDSVLFYDYFAISNRGLTQQYLSALIELDFKITYVVSNDNFYNSSFDIIKQLKDYGKSRIIIYSQKLSITERIGRLNSLIEEIKPQYIFLHLSPWDVIACSVFPLHHSAKKYFINLTDHAFWLGKRSLDICLEFRNYGIQLSKQLRGIEHYKIRLLPYYPITQADDTFKGFPEDTEGKVIGLSGGSGYKFVGDNWRFYNLIKSLLLQHENFIFFLVGMNGAAKWSYQQRVANDKLNGRFIFVEDRYDIFPLIKNIDIYFGSYPFPGGLMSQMACLANKPIITYVNPDFLFSYIEDVIPFRNKEYASYNTPEEFLEAAGKLIKSKAYRQEFAALTSGGIITKEQFNNCLSQILKDENPYLSLEQPICLKGLANSMSAWHLEIENTINKGYYNDYIAWFNLANRNGHPNEYLLRKQKYQGNNKQITRQKVKGLLKSVYAKLLYKVRSIRKRKIKFTELPFQKLGENAIVNGEFIIKNPAFISLGKNLFGLNNLRVEAWDEYMGERFHPELVIGDNVIFNCDCHIGCINKVVIGNNVLMASRIFISDHSHGEINRTALKLPPVKRSLYSKGPVIIEDNVWIGEGVSILPGVTIGANSIIGANAVVTKSIPSNCVVGGIPAKILKEIT